MALKKLLLTATALPLLAACGGGTATGLDPVETYLAADTASGTFEEQLAGSGVTGFMGNADGTVSEIRIRVDDSDPENPLFFLSRDGGAEENYILEFVGEGVFFLTNLDGDFLRVTNWGDDFETIELSDLDENYVGEGTLGLRTALADMPTDVARFYGGWDASGDTETGGAGAGGEMQLTVDFGSGKLLGTPKADFITGTTFSKTKLAAALQAQSAAPSTATA